ncbi:uncharacterized protein LOC129871191 [Solanum dulcamara]|uniref:uncharacterized protein LOC129871191 n=1 Tax=Solanum dulcamara TaxID=45834 RepID=UPI0024858E01|nr:uncharacterized protein LOC129871191 [Solanum dulcamara]
MYQTIKEHYWWNSMKKDIAKFTSRCLVCQQIKAEHQVPTGLLELLSIPEWKWERITMDFVSGLLCTQRNHDAIWVVVDRLTKNAHFLAIKMDYPLEHLAELYVEEIVRLHRVPVSIVSDQDPRFTSRFWTRLQEPLGTRLNFSTSFHLQTDGQSERIVQQTEDKVKVIKDHLKIASDRQKSYADLKRCEIEYQVGDKVFLKISPWKKIMIFGQKGKLIPRFIGPYEVLERVGPVVYKLALPPELDKIHNVFHVSMLRRYGSDPSHILPVESIEINPDQTYNEEPIQILARERKELRNKKVLLVKVLWRNHSGNKATWEREEDMQIPYPHLF